MWPVGGEREGVLEGDLLSTATVLATRNMMQGRLHYSCFWKVDDTLGIEV